MTGTGGEARGARGARGASGVTGTSGARDLPCLASLAGDSWVRLLEVSERPGLVCREEAEPASNSSWPN